MPEILEIRLYYMGGALRRPPNTALFFGLEAGGHLLRAWGARTPQEVAGEFRETHICLIALVVVVVIVGIM